MADKGRKLTKNERKRLKKKTEKQQKEVEPRMEDDSTDIPPPPPPPPEEQVTVEYVSAPITDPTLVQFQDIFAKFASVEELMAPPTAPQPENAKSESHTAYDEAETAQEEHAEEDDGKPKLSRKQRKMLSRFSVATLKQQVARPDVVEAHDVTASDPVLLVYLKAYRNTVPVPRHWCHKRKYLQGKRGIDKPPFQLPEFIATTGIEKIRTSVMDQEMDATAKQKNRARAAPKMGKIDIDYQVLHDAFFKYQKKPKMCPFGDIYYEGKEFEVKLREKKPGVLSGALKKALGMSEGHPPPWLMNMQRYGPPPSYPNLKIPGLNCPIPEGQDFGFHPGGWGKPPVDELNRPIYGDVFGKAPKLADEEIQVNRTLWGEMTEAVEESEEEEEEEEGDEIPDVEMEADPTDMSGLETPATEAGMSSVTTGLETPETIDLRKRRSGFDSPDTSGIDNPPKELYQVVEEKAQKVGGGHLFGTDKKYVLPAGGASDEGAAVEYQEPEPTEQDDQRKRKRKADKEKDAKKKKHDDFKF